MHPHRLLCAAALVGLGLWTTPADASLDRYTVNWNTIIFGGGQSHAGVTVTGRFIGTGRIRTSGESYPGPWVGYGGVASLEVSFSAPVLEHCIYVTAQDSAEVLTIRTNRASGNTYSTLDTGSSRSTLSGNTVRWTSVIGSNRDEGRVCVRNTAGLSWVRWEMNGVQAGSVYTSRIWIDPEVCERVTWYRDDDGDGYGGSTSTSSCTSPGAAWTRVGGDCNDANDTINPGAAEAIADGVDQNCDGRETCYQDNDRDTWRTNLTTSTTVTSCARASGFALATASSVDCDDFDAATYPGATEVIADGKDQSCSGTELCYQDLDGDDWRTDEITESSDISCTDDGLALASVARLDCDDDDPRTYPGASEIIADGKDQSCSGTELCYQDLDGDDWRTDRITETSDISCVGAGLALATVPGIDCDDTDATVYPGAAEIPYDGIDQSCSGADLCDVDGDGFDAGLGECFGLDCDDESDEIHPLAEEVWYDDIDQNCDGWSDYDADYDGFDSADHEQPDGTIGTDCDDDDPTINLDAEEIWYDGVDQDCDGGSDYDADFDGFDTAWIRQPDGSIGDDCDDDDPDVYPGAPSLPDGKDNNCDGITDRTDSDNDGIPDEIEQLIGTDPFNPDTDGDSLWDGMEVGDDWSLPHDADGDGVIDALDPDDDGDGIDTRIEVGPTSTLRDTDGDGTPDYLDLDSDSDGVPDAIEGTVDTDHDGLPDYRDLDSDADGVLDADEVDGDSDDDGRPDRIDPDDDGDGWSTYVEQGWDPRTIEGAPDYWADVPDWDPADLDSDGVPNYLDPDTDGDGRLDADEGHGDDDCDGLPNVLDPDDGDGPCGDGPTTTGTYQGGACTGASHTGAPAALWLALLVVIGARRRHG